MKFWKRRRDVVTPKACPSCGALLGDHVQVDIASAEINSADDERLTELIANGAWGEAMAYQAANVPGDIRAWRRIRCGDGRVGVVARVMPIEIWTDDFYEEPWWLTGDEAEALEAVTSLMAPKERQYLPDPDPDMKPCAPEIKERLLADFDAMNRRYLRWRNAILIVAGIVLVCVVALLVLRR